MQYLAIDVGGTTTKYGLVSATGALSQQGEQPTMRASLADFMASLTGLIRLHKAHVAGIGLALPGVIDSQQGLVKASATLPFLEGLVLGTQLTTAADLTVPILIENDGNAAALAEHWRGNLALCCWRTQFHGDQWPNPDHARANRGRLVSGGDDQCDGRCLRCARRTDWPARFSSTN